MTHLKSPWNLQWYIPLAMGREMTQIAWYILIHISMWRELHTGLVMGLQRLHISSKGVACRTSSKGTAHILPKETVHSSSKGAVYSSLREMGPRSFKKASCSASKGAVGTVHSPSKGVACSLSNEAVCSFSKGAVCSPSLGVVQFL